MPPAAVAGRFLGTGIHLSGYTTPQELTQRERISVRDSFVAKAIVSLPVYDTQLQVRERLLGRASTAPIGGFMNNLLKQAASLSLFVKWVAAVVGILLIHVTFRVLEQILPRRFRRADARYKVSSSSSFPDTSRFSFFSLSSLKIAWAA